MKDSVCSFKQRVDFRGADIRLMKFHALVDVFSRSRRQIINSYDRIAPIEQSLGQVAADESRHAGHNNTPPHTSSSLSDTSLWLIKWHSSQRPHIGRCNLFDVTLEVLPIIPNRAQ